MLDLGDRTHDLRTRALVIGALGRADKLVEHGADLVERTDRDGWFQMPIPVYVTATDEAAVERALAAGAGLIHLPQPTPAGLAMCATAGVAVLVPAGLTAEAAAAGIIAQRIVPDSLLLDVTAATCPVAATAVGVIRGARLVRATAADVRGARRVADVLAAVMGAG